MQEGTEGRREFDVSPNEKGGEGQTNAAANYYRKKSDASQTLSRIKNANRHPPGWLPGFLKMFTFP